MAISLRKFFFNYLPFVLLWFVVSVVVVLIYYDPKVSALPQLICNFSGTILSLPLSWYAATKMVPRYLYHKKIRSFMVKIIYLILANVAVVYVVIAGLYYLLTGAPVIRPVFVLLLLVLLQLFVNLIFISIACGVKIITDRYGLVTRMNEIEKEKISTELNFLRSQINPHFLFNILNTIYFQIDKSNLPARQSVEKFSEMLRYQLYDCNTDKIELLREIDYIKSYVALQSQRLETGTDIELRIGKGMEGFSIAPFMILTLVENAFKHISHFKNAADNKIFIEVIKEENRLVLKSLNTYDRNENAEQLVQTGGLGLQNLKRRLELLYHDKYELVVNNSESIFETTLYIQLQ